MNKFTMKPAAGLYLLQKEPHCGCQVPIIADITNRLALIRRGIKLRPHQQIRKNKFEV